MKMNEQHYLPCPICGQSCKAEVALGYAERSAVRNVVAFGHGFYGVDIGTLGDHPAVFIIPNEKPGQVGERVPLDLQLPLERESLPDDWTVLLFPTRDRCKEVADALVGSKMDQWKDELIQPTAHGGGTEERVDEPKFGCKSAGGFVDSNCMAACDCHKTMRLDRPSDPAQEPEAVAHKTDHDRLTAIWKMVDPRANKDIDYAVRSDEIVTMVAKALRTRPVSLDREAVFQAAYENASSALDEDDIETQTENITDAILALIEGRT